MTRAGAERPAYRPRHVAVLCQYGIYGVHDKKGIERYLDGASTLLAEQAPDILILSGGGRFGASAVREADSVAHLLRRNLPRTRVWVERHSVSSWDNIWNSALLLLSMGLRPERITVVVDSKRRFKVRLAGWLTRLRLPALRGARVEVRGVARSRSGLRELPVVQSSLGASQIVLQAVAASNPLGVRQEGS